MNIKGLLAALLRKHKQKHCSDRYVQFRFYSEGTSCLECADCGKNVGTVHINNGAIPIVNIHNGRQATIKGLPVIMGIDMASGSDCSVEYTQRGKQYDPVRLRLNQQ